MITSAPKLHQHQSINPNWSHDRLQQECFQFLWNNYPQIRRTFFHSPNEFPRQRGMTQREHTIILSQRKAIGVLSGVIDLVWYYKGVLYMFDIKLGKDSLSDAQKDFISAMVAQGGVFQEISSLDQFKSIVNSIMQEAKQ